MYDFCRHQETFCAREVLLIEVPCHICSRLTTYRYLSLFSIIAGEDDPVIQSLGLRLECKTRRFVTDETQELHFRIEIQNKVYKREVAALDKEIGRLEKLLAEPLESTSSSSASIALHKRVSIKLLKHIYW